MPILLLVFRERRFLSLICRGFSYLCGFVVLHYFLEGSSIYSLFIETKEVHRLIMRVSSTNVCLLSCWFYYTYETCEHFAL